MASDPYTPETNEVRAHYVSARMLLLPTWAPSPAEEFDRWLAGVKADAWDEGFAAEYDSDGRVVNPYLGESH